jgi:hypothetical protein
LARTVRAGGALRQACDYARRGAVVPALLRDLHAAATAADRPAALRLLCDVAFMAFNIV